MQRSARDWTEDYILSLPTGEDDSFERKGTTLLDLTLSAASEDAVRDELAKQLSAFANTGGGAIIYGVNDRGQVDVGGVSRVIRGRQSTKAWLESVIPRLTEFEIVGVNVFEVMASGPNSRIGPDKSIFVIDVPDSDRAPHQSTRDHRYYVRLGGTSQPAPHRLVEDISNRARHPLVVVRRLEIRSSALPFLYQPAFSLSGRLELRFDAWVKNVGHVKASDVCLAVEGSGTDLDFQGSNPDVARVRLISKGNCRFLEIDDPIYPGLELNIALNCSLVVRLAEYVPGANALWVTNNRNVEETGIRWTIFADSAPPTSDVIPFKSFSLSASLFSQTENSQHKAGFCKHFDRHKSFG